MEEIWKDIKGYEGYYMISSYGNVKSLKRVVVRNNNSPLLVEEKILKCTKAKNGYIYVSLRNNGIKKMCLVHRLVAEAFIPNPDNLPFINHKDEKPSNNCVSNLEWCTQKHNMNWGTVKERISETHKGMKQTEETINKRVSKLIGHNVSEITRNKIGNANRNGKCSKSVLQYDLDGNLIAEFPSTMEVERKLGFLNSNIGLCCRGKYKQAYGYIWKYKESVA